MPAPDATRARERKAAAAEDRRLLGEIVARRPEALSTLYDRYAGMLLALANRVLGDLGDSEEILQEAFLQVWNQAERYDATRSSVSTWLVLITRSRAIDRLRSRRVAERTVHAAEKERAQTHASPEGPAHVFNQERRDRLEDELGRLPAEQRQVLEMAFYRGMTQSEIAEATSIPLGTVKTRTLLAIRKLRRALRADFEELL